MLTIPVWPTTSASAANLGLPYAAGAAAFVVVAVTFKAVEAELLVAGALILSAAAIVGIGRAWGVGYAVPAAMAAVLAFDWFEVPKTHALEVLDLANLAELLVFVGLSVLIGKGAASAIRRSEASEAPRAGLLEEQAALRRVATLVARGAEPDAVFAAVAREVGLLLAVDAAALTRREGDAEIEVARWSAPGESAVDGTVLTRPVLLEGRVWGVLAVRDARELAAGTPERLESFAELIATAISNVEVRAELAVSRARIVAAADAERHRVVRDLHDGAQQRLVHTVITLKLARSVLATGGDAAGLVAEALQHAESGNEELRELAHGILPRTLTRGGLRASIEALASRMPLPVDVGVPADRLPPRVEAAAYFVVAEALTNVAKHAHAEHAEILARVEDATLCIDVRDDGVGGARLDGSGIVGLGDRLALLDGRLRVESPPGGGTLISVAIPLPLR